MLSKYFSNAVSSLFVYMVAIGSSYAQPAKAPEKIDPFLKFQLTEVDETQKHRNEFNVLEPAIFTNAPWVQLQFGLTAFDARNDVVGGRLTPGLVVGYRTKSQGIFALFELDRVFDFTLDNSHIDILNVGIGFEYLLFLGRVRSSFAAGASLLLSGTDIDGRGETGWFIDFRPTSLRWPVGDHSAFELAPLTIDVVAPVTEGIPLVLFHYLTVLSWEQSFQ